MKCYTFYKKLLSRPQRADFEIKTAAVAENKPEDVSNELEKSSETQNSGSTEEEVVL